MKQPTPYILLIFFAVLFDISQSEGDCFYFGSHHGTKCFDPSSNKYTCCSLDHHCTNGKCTPLGATQPSKSLPFSTAILIGVGASVFCVIFLILGAMYWHRRQMKNTEKRLNPLASFSQSTYETSRSGNSAGFRVRSPTSQTTSKETSVNIEQSTTTVIP